MANRTDDLFKLENFIDINLARGNNKTAIKGMLFLISKYAEKNNFKKATALRERIIEVDPAALTEAVRAQDIIDRARVKPANRSHLETWAPLYSRLTREEAKTLLTELQEMVFQPGETIFAQGEKISNLYFIDAGQAKHLFSQGNREVFIKKIGPGNIANEDPFFNAALCTSTLVAADMVMLHFLPAASLIAWQEQQPALESKLRSFCAKEEKIHDLLTKNYQDRRGQRRISLPGRILIKIVDSSGQVVGHNIRGNIVDVSVGGVSLFVQTVTREQALMLLGHNLHLRFNMPPAMSEIEQIGQVLAVKRHLVGAGKTEKYSVHVRFSEMLSNQSIIDAERFIKMLKIAESHQE